MFELKVAGDDRPGIDYLYRVKAGLGDKALVSALNATASQARTQMIRGITREYKINASLVRERLQVQRAKRNGMQFTATLLGNPAGMKGRAMNLIHFVERVTTLASARKRRKQGTLNDVYFQIRRTGGKQTIEGTFIANQGRTVFRRVGPSRLPIEPIQTIGVPQMFQAKKVQLPVQRWITDNFPRIWDHELRYYLSTVR